MWNINQSIKENYLKVCEDAVKDDVVFKNFRQNSHYREILEHVPKDKGDLYFSYIVENYPHLLQHFDRFNTSERFGSTYFYNYNIDNNASIEFSSTTIRYIKVLGDLEKHFGSLDDLNIVEIGGGYGGQCKIIHDLYKPSSYHIFDDDKVWPLQKKFLTKTIKTPHWITFNDFNFNTGFTLDHKYDICISNYCFDELADELRSMYNENIIKQSNGFYITSVNDISSYIKSSDLVIPQKEYFNGQNHNIFIKKILKLEEVEDIY